MLVVDDQSTHRAILAELVLGIDAAAEVVTCAEPAEALARAEQGPADLVLVDYSMPGMDGIELVCRLRRLPGYAHVPIVMVTMHDARELRYAALDAGATDFLTKPLDVRECRARCRNLLALGLQQRALERRSHAERAGRAQLEEVNRDLASFAHTVSHDLRAPLRHIASYVGRIADTAAVREDAEALRLVARARAAALRLRAMVDELLRIAQLGRRPLQPARIDLERLVAELRDELAAGLGARRVEWRIGALPAVHADPTLLRLALQNLLDNALKFSACRDPARVELSAELGPGRVTLCVRDNGVGFDSAQAAGLFDAFVRLHCEAEFPGTGVGLAHVKRIVERHGGTVRAESQPGSGAAFFLVLPREPGAP